MRTTARALALILGLTCSAAAQAPPPVPALPDVSRVNTFVLSGTTCACSVGFNLYGDGTDIDNWLQVTIGTTQYLSTDPVFGWRITSPTGSLSTIPRPITDAILTFNQAQSGQVIIVGAQRPRRLSEFSEARGVPARDHNQVLNTLFAEMREAWDKLNRAIVGQPGEIFKPLPGPGSRAGGVLAFDVLGQPTIQLNIPAGGIPVNSITNSLLAAMPANTFKCNPTGSPANPQDCPGTIRVKLPTGTTNFYANSSATGCGGVPCLDTNDGLTTATAKKTVLGALYGILNGYDFTCTVATQTTAKVNLLSNEVNAGASVHFGPHDFQGACAGGSVIFDGGNFTYEYDSGASAAIAPFFTVPFLLQNVVLANTSGPCIALFEKADMRFGAGVNFGNCGIALQLFGGSTAVFLNNFTISLNATQTAFIQADENSTLSFGAGITGTCTGTPQWTWMILAQKGSSINLNSMSWSGCGGAITTASAYLVTDGSSIVNGAASIPGNNPGVTNSGGTADGAAVAVSAGGTGASTVSGARVGLGLPPTGTPTIASGACGTGTNGTISGTNTSGVITIGAAGTTTCTIGFSGTIVAPGACLIAPGNAAAAAQGTTLARVGTPSTTQWVITGSALASTVYSYICL